MPASGIGSASQNFGVASTPANGRNQTYYSSELARNIIKLQQLTYEFRRGHQRKDAVDFRLETSIKLKGFGNSASRFTATLVDILGSGTKIKT